MINDLAVHGASELFGAAYGARLLSEVAPPRDLQDLPGPAAVLERQ